MSATTQRPICPAPPTTANTTYTTHWITNNSHFSPFHCSTCKCWNQVVGVSLILLARAFFLLWRALANFWGTGQGRAPSDQQSNCQKINSLMSRFTGEGLVPSF